MEFGCELEQSQRVGDDSAALADFGGGGLLRELELLDELRVAEGFLDGVEVLALEVFDEREFHHRAVIGLADDDGNGLKTEELRGPPTALARDELKAIAARADDEWREDALRLDGIGQLAKRVRSEILARLEGARMHACDGDGADVLAGRG